MMSQRYSILSLDGGGIRGLVTALILQDLENKIQQRSQNKQLKDCFDLIVGTSTGSLIACGLSYGVSISKIVEFYSLESGFPQQIFPPTFRSYLTGFVNRLHLGISQPMYDGKGLEAVLQNIFKTTTFDQLKIQTLVTSYDVYNGQAVVFNSKQSECKTLPIWEVCRASAAAPIAFPAHIIQDKTYLSYWHAKGYKLTNNPENNHLCIPLIDGGVAANNPTLCAVAEAIKAKKHPSNLVVASLGCGTQKTKSISVKKSRGWGAFEWINPLNDMPILETIQDGSSDVIDHISRHLVNSNNYYRFQPYFKQKHSTFKANQKNIDALKQETLRYIQSSEVQKKLYHLAIQLTATSVSPVVQSKKQLQAVSSHLN